MPNKHDWPKGKGMPIRCRVYIPSTQGMTQRIPVYIHRKRAKEVEKKMISLFGGSTKIKSQGSWFEAGVTVSEPILLVESYTTREKWNRNDKKLKAFLQQKKKEWEQKSLSMEWEDLGKNLQYEGMRFL